MQKGCACTFLFGPETDEGHKKAICAALDSKSELKLEVTFYKSDGTAFKCLLDIVPIKNEKHQVVLFLASHKDVSKSAIKEHKEHSSKGESTSEEEDDDDDDDSGQSSDGSTGDHDMHSRSANPYARRRSRAVLYQLSGHYRRSVAGKSKLKLNNVSTFLKLSRFRFHLIMTLRLTFRTQRVLSLASLNFYAFWTVLSSSH